MSTSYKPALLKSIARITRRQPSRHISLTSIGAEFVHLYWNQTVIFHLRQAAVLTKETEIIKAIRRASIDNKTRNLDKLSETARKQLNARTARILAQDVLRRFHINAPPSMPPLFEWNKGDEGIELSDPALTFIVSNSYVLESLSNLWWARYLERVNVLTPFIIEKVEREGAQRTSLMKFLRILQDSDDKHCFYCERAFSADLSINVDHFIPWSYLLANPPWDLVLACTACNSAKSDTLPSARFLDKLAIVNARRGKLLLPTSLGSPLISIEQVRKFYDAALAVEWPEGWPMRIDYNKLVRDKVPQAIEADGHTYSIAPLSPNDFIFELRRKLVEEAQEALQASSHDDLLIELADLLEVIKTLLEASGISFEMLEAKRQTRRKQKGGFEHRLLLQYVDRLG